MASIRERPSTTKGGLPSYRVEWRIGGRGGKPQSVTLPTRDLAEAAAALAKSRSHHITDTEVYQVVLGLTPDSTPQCPTLAEWRDDYLTQRRKELDVQSDTVAGYAKVIDLRILPYLGHYRLDQINGDLRREWLDWLAKQPSRRGGTLSDGTIRIAHGVLHNLLDAAVPRWLPANPLARRPGSRKRTAGLPRAGRYDAVFLTPQELQILRNNCPPRLRDLVDVDVATGLRLGELLVLRVGHDVTFTSGGCVIHVRRALKKDGRIGKPKSRRSIRDVDAGANTAAILRRLSEGKRRGDLLFTAPRGGMWVPSNLNRRYWRPAVAAAMRCAEHPPPPPPKPKSGPTRGWRPDEVSTCDCPTRLHRAPRFHDLRHTHVSACVADGWDQLRVRDRVGHDSIQTTIDIYGHLWRPPAEQLDSLERLLLLAADEEA
jgi:integrase